MIYCFLTVRKDWQRKLGLRKYKRRTLHLGRRSKIQYQLKELRVEERLHFTGWLARLSFYWSKYSSMLPDVLLFVFCFSLLSKLSTFQTNSGDAGFTFRIMVEECLTTISQTCLEEVLLLTPSLLKSLRTDC